MNAQDQFVIAPDKNPLPRPTIHGHSPFLTDIDSDGDLDLLLTASDRLPDLYENTGSGTEPVFIRIKNDDNPFRNYTGEYYMSSSDIVAGADLDNDGDTDIITPYTILWNTGSNETITYIETNESEQINTFYFESTGSDPLEFVQRTGSDNPLEFVNNENYVDLGRIGTPAFSDINYVSLFVIYE